MVPYTSRQLVIKNNRHLLSFKIQKKSRKMKLTFMTIAHEGGRQSEVFLSCHTHTRTHGQQQ